MRIFRATNPIVMDYIGPKLIDSDDFEDPKVLIDGIKQTLVNDPRNIFVEVGFDEEEDEPELKLFVIAHAPPGQKHVFAIQAWVDPSLAGTGAAEKAFLKLVLWATELGRGKIRIETKRSKDAWFRRWDFKEFSRILEYEIPEDFEIEIFKKGLKNVTRIENKREVEAGQEPESSSEPADKLHNEAASSSDSLHRGVGRSTDS